jgi:hypothetical protein
MATSISKLLIRLQKFSSKISKVVDATESFNKGSFYIQDLSGWDSAVVQFGTITDGPITFYTTNDDGARILGQLLPAPEVIDQFLPVKGIDLSTKGDVLVASDDSIVEFGIIGKYLSLAGPEPAYPANYAYVISKNTFPTASEAYISGRSQGTTIVYATTPTLTSSNLFYSTSALTQPIYGDGTSWYSAKRLDGTGPDYALQINGAGALYID